MKFLYVNFNFMCGCYLNSYIGYWRFRKVCGYFCGVLWKLRILGCRDGS